LEEFLCAIASKLFCLRRGFEDLELNLGNLIIPQIAKGVLKL